MTDELVIQRAIDEWATIAGGPLADGEPKVTLARYIAAKLHRASEGATASLCGECGGPLVDHRCVDCGTRHDAGAPNEGRHTPLCFVAATRGEDCICGLTDWLRERQAPEDDPELVEHYGPCCDEGTCEPGPCGDPACPVLHADPTNPIHPPGGPSADSKAASS